ncbi:MAG: hypothetical protein LBT92_03905 [Rickettsiales bacterium]|nr:hypothetical protein [Rickettsiales bacterium]
MKGLQKNSVVLLCAFAFACPRFAAAAAPDGRSNFATIDDLVALPPNAAFAPDVPMPAQGRDAGGGGDSEFASESVAELGRMNEELVKQLSGIKRQVDAIDLGIMASSVRQAKQPPVRAAADGKVARAQEPVAPLNTEEEIVFEPLKPGPGPQSAEPEAGAAPDIAAVEKPIEKPAESGQIANGSPFGVSVTPIPHRRLQSSIVNRIEFEDAANRRASAMFSQAKPKANPFVKTFSAIRPQKQAAPSAAPPRPAPAARPARPVRRNMSSVSLKRELRSAYMSENKYLSAAEDGEDEEEWEEEEYEEYEEEEEVDSEDAPQSQPPPSAAPPAESAGPKPEPDAKRTELASAGAAGVIGAVKSHDGKRKTGGVTDLPPGPLKVGSREVLQMKLEFNPDDGAISAESVNIIRSFAQIVTDSPTKTIEIGVSERVVADDRLKKLTAKRIALVSNVLRHAGVSDRQIKPILTSRDPDSFSFRAVDNDVFERLSVTKGEVDAFGEGSTTTSYELMRW